MKLPLRQSAAAERKALGTTAAPLPAYAGTTHYLRQLASDASYRWALGLALALALFAGSDFGRLADVSGDVVAGLWVALVATMAARLLVPIEDDDGGATTAAVMFAAVGGLVVSATVGQAGRVPWAPVIGFGVTFFLQGPIRWTFKSSRLRRLFDYLLIAAWFVATLWPLPNLVLDDAVLRKVVILAGAVVVDSLLSGRQGIAAAMTAIIVLHLGTLLLFTAPVAPAWTQILAAAAETLLLAYAEYRNSAAVVARLPQSTYRIAPKCVVALLDRATEHPVQIDVG